VLAVPIQFLKFFFQRLKGNDTDFHPDYIYASPCGKEMNFIKPADTPFVFTDLSSGGELQVGDPVSTTVPFDPSALHVSHGSGRLYHPMAALTTRKKASDGDTAAGFGLIRSQLAVRLSEDMDFDDDGGGSIVWEGQSHPLCVLPPEADIAVALA